MTDFLTFGEIMLRLRTNGYERFFQSPSFEATFGGGEANVAVSLCNYGLDAGFISALPDNDICLLYTSPSPRDQRGSRMPSSA